MRSPVINSDDENNYILNNFNFDKIWIGLNDISVEKTFRWSWGDQITQYQTWESGEPNNKDNEDCVQLIKSSRKWNDEGCGDSFQSICAICKLGTYFDGKVCVSCPGGTFANYLNTEDHCSRCPSGYVSSSGSLSCTQCNRGTYANSDQTACISCPPGTISDVGSTSSNQCSSCSDGYYVRDTYCVSCAPSGADPTRFIGGGASSDSCRCRSPWAGPRCDITECPGRLSGLSLGGLYLQSIPDLKNYSKSFSTTTIETNQAVRDLLENIFYVIVDLDGDEVITKTEMLASLSSKGITNTSLTTFPLWCSTYTVQSCFSDSYDCASFINDAYNNYIYTQSHEFDSSSLSVLNSFYASFPDSTWSDSQCSNNRNREVSVQWTFKPNRPALYRVCGYTNGFLDPSFGGANIISGSVTSFNDINPITSIIGFKRIYCVEVSYCADSSSSSYCSPTTPGFTTGISCTVGLRYDYTPIDLVPFLAENGVSFTYMDTAATETRFDIFFGRNGAASTHMVSVPYPADGCGRISTPISFTDRINADLVGRNLVYGVRAVLPTGPTSLTTTNYRIPFIGTITGSVKTSTGAPVKDVTITLCHIDPNTGDDDTISTYCPLTDTKTDQRGLYSIDVRVSSYRWNSTTEQFRIIASYIEIIDGEELVHTFSPADQIITLKHRYSSLANFVDETSVTIRGNVKFHPDLVAGELCPFEGVTIFLNSTTGISNTTTDSSGNFLFSISRTDSATVYIPSGWNGHSWIVNASLSSLNLPSPKISSKTYLNFAAPDFSTTRRQLQTTTLVAQYPLDGNANDVSGNGNHGTLSSVTFTTDRFGVSNSAASFGSSGAVILPSIAASGNAARSMTAWVKTSSTSDQAIIVTGTTVTSQGFNLLLLSSGSRFTVSGYSYDFTPTDCPNINDNIWHHLAATFDGTTLNMYVDGNLCGSTTRTYETSGQSNSLSKSSSSGTGSGLGVKSFLGSMDDVRFYTGALTTSQVGGIYTESTYSPSISPTFIPSRPPTRSPTRSPSRLPTLFPTRQPSVIPTLQPTTEPTIEPTIEPSVEPSIEPTIEPTIAPTVEPTLLPTRLPTRFPTRSPTRSPTRPPTVLPTRPPTVEPTLLPTVEPTLLPTMEPTFTPTISFSPTRSPTRLPTTLPTRIPSVLPTFVPTFAPTTLPTRVPSVLPTFVPTFAPTTAPTRSPTIPPSRIPTRSPTFAPSNIPTFSPSTSPTFTPTFLPSNSPTFRPSSPPTLSPTKFYSSNDIALLHDYDFFDNQDSIGNSILQTTGTVSIFEGFATFLGLSNSYITIPDRPLREASAVTFELWVDIAPTNDVNSVLFSFGPSSNSFSYKSNHQGVSQYIAVVLSNSNGVTRGKVYINGVLVSTRDVIESSLLGGFIANNDIPGYLGRDVTGTSPPFTGTFKTFRIWWGELSPTTIYSNSAIDGVEQQAIKLTSQMTKADVQINFFFTSKQNIQIGFYGAADNKVKMFNDNVKFDIKATTCPFKIIGRLDADGNEYIGSIPALNYTVTMNSFTYTFPNFQLPTTPLFGEPICADNLQPYDYIEKTNQLNQDLIIPSVISDRYSIEYYYRSGVCVYFDNAINFNTLQQPIAPPPSATPAFQNEACYPKSITVLKEEVPYNITIFIFERYPMSASNGRVVLGTNLSDATIYITDDVSAKNERLIIPFVGDSKSELTPLANLTGYRYTLNPKNPFPVSPFYLKFEITVEKPITQLLTNRITQTWYIPVTGVLTNPFSTFIPVATDPTLIFLVLRDPPGGGSYTTIESGTSIEFSMSLEGMYTFDHGQSWDFNLGAGIFNDFTVPLVGTKLTDVETILLGGGASLGSTLTTTRGSSTHYQYSFEFTSSFSTSQSPNDAGHGSDIIIGGGVDLIVLEGLAVKKREINNYVCFHSESSRIWSPGKVTTFVLAVREIELTINKLTYIASTETNVTIQRQLNKQITNWQTVLSNYRDHNEDLTNIFHADEMLLNQEINNFAETLQIKAQSMEFDTRYDSRLNGDGFSDLDGKLNEMKYNIQSKCGQLESYSVATSMCNQFDNNNWNTVSKAIQNGACELIIPNQDEGKLKYNTITTTSSGKGGNANQYTKQVFAGYTKASPTSLKDLTILQQFCLQRQATISGIPGGAIINAKNSIFGFLEDNNKLVTFGSGTETSFSYTSTVTNAISLSSGFSYQFDTSGGIYTDLKLGVGAVLIKGGSSTMFSHDRDLSTNVDVDSNRLTKRTVTVTLFDPDPNDYFAVRISSDPTYGTPVFTTMGGQSSCPAETATLARESGVSIIDIIPRCGEFGAAGACTSLPTGTTAHFTVRIVNLSPTRDDVIYTLGFDSLFDEAPLEATSSYQLCNNLNPKEGQRSGLIASFSTTQLTNLPYGIPVEILVSIDNKGPCKNYRQVRFRIQSECETVYKYQYQAIRNTKTGNINILYNQTAPRLSDTRGFDVSWQYSTTTQQFSSGGDDSSTNISSNISFSFLIIILIFLILSSILQISIFWFLQHQLTEIRASNPASPQQSNSSKSFYFSGSYRSTDDGLSVPQLEISNEENPNSVNQEILDQESLTPTTKVMSQI